MEYIIRQFRTKNFRVVVSAEPEYDLDLSFDETGEVREKLDSGEYTAFCAKAAVYGPNGEELATDYLGNCIYESFDSFMDHRACGKQNAEFERKGDSARCGSYFASMVSEVCQEARKTFCDSRRRNNTIRMRQEAL